MAEISLEEAKAALARKRAAKQVDASQQSFGSPVDDLNAMEAGLIATGKGMTDILRLGQEGFNKITGNEQAQAQLEAIKAREAESFGMLEEEFPISAGVGEFVGETAATLPLAMTGGGLAVKGASKVIQNPLLQRLIGSGTGGAIEGGLVAATEDAGAEGAAFGGGAAITAELLLPRLAGVAKRVFKNPDIKIENIVEVAEGTFQPTAQFKEALDAVGMSLDDITQEAVRDIPRGANPSQVAREQLFQTEGITPAAKGRITQSPDDFQRELQLVRQRGDVDGGNATINQFRDRFFDESEQIQTNIGRLAETLGDPDDVATVKTALQSLNSNIQSAKTQAYRELGELAAENPELTRRIPIQSENVLDATRGAQEFLDDGMANKVDEVLAEFGLIGTPQATQGRFTTVDFGDGDTIRVRGGIKQLDVGNLEDFRKRFNNIFDPQDSRHVAAKAQILEAVDDSTDVLVDGIQDIPGLELPQSIVDTAQRARGLAREQKVLFSQKDLVDNLISTKAGTVTPVVEASKALQKIKGAPIEQTTKLVRTLRQAGVEGEDAIRNLQAAKVVELLENSTANSSKLSRSSGESILDFNGKNFSKALTKERDLLNTLFQDNPDALAKLKRLGVIGQLRVTPEMAAQKGSAPDLINSILRGIETGGSKIPAVGSKVEDVAAGELAKRESKVLSNVAPTQDTVEDFIVFNAPRLAVGLGLTSAATGQAAKPNKAE